MKRNWKRVRPTSLLHALELCVEYARDVHNLSVERIADRMGETTHHALYKWLAEGGMPMRKLRPFEHACGCKYASRWVAMSGDLLTIDIPTGRSATCADVMALQETLNDAVGALLQFYQGKLSPDEVLTSVTAGMEGLAFHRENVKKHDQPELDLQ